MALPTTGKYEHLAIQVEEPDGSGTYIGICGMKDATFERTATVDTAEIPDCDDESLPYSVERQVRSLDFKISGDGIWAASSHEMMLDWFYSSATKNIRVRHVRAAVGDTEYESGPALLSTLTHGKTKGQKISGTLAIEFDGTPTRTPKA